MITKAITALGSALGFKARPQVAPVATPAEARKLTRKQILRRIHCARLQRVFKCPRGTKAHRRFFFLTNPGYFAKA